MDLKKQILVALGLNKEQEEVNLEFQAKLEDGTIIVSTAVTLESGSDISVLTEDGSTILLPEGKYKTDEGLQFSVEKEGIVAELYTDEERETEGNPEEEELEEEADVADWKGMEKRIQNLEDAISDLKNDKEGSDLAEDDGKEADVEDWAGMEKRIQNLEDAVADLKKDKVGNVEDEESDVEMDSAPNTTPKKIKTTEEVEFEYQAKIDELKSKVVELSNEPADVPVVINKLSKEKNDLRPSGKKLSRRERILYNIINK
tara:strand:- start:576 stop:1352 length:777 start_codon:yes stop_codon:yes gene_type:complete